MFSYVSVRDESVVFASMTGGSILAANPMPFNSILANNRQRWNESSHSYTMHAAQGVVWIGLIVGSPGATPIDYVLEKDGERFAGISASSTTHTTVINTGRDFALKLMVSESFSVASGYNMHSDSVRQTGLAAFSLTDAMVSPLIAFCVARDEPLFGQTDPIAFNIDVYNEGFYYNWVTHAFHASSNGIYFFTFSVGVQQGQTAEIILHKNGEPFANLIRQSTSHNGNSTMSRSIMMTLETGSSVHIVNNNNQMALSSKLLETSFSGFKYDPVHRNQVSRPI